MSGTPAALLLVAVLGTAGPVLAQRAGAVPGVWRVRPDSITVGDTAYLSRTLPAPAGVSARAPMLARTSVVEPLGEPEIEIARGVLTLTYSLALFEPGRQAILMPAVELFYADGTVETIEGDTAVVRVRSVLPEQDTLLVPRPALGPLARPIRRRGPVLLLVGLAVLAAGAWGIARRRVGPRPARAVPPPVAASPPIAAWVEAGELRAAAAYLADDLRRRLAKLEPDARSNLDVESLMAVLRRRRPEWPLRDLEDLMRALERARFAPAVPTDLLALSEQVALLIEELPGGLEAAS